MEPPKYDVDVGFTVPLQANIDLRRRALTRSILNKGLKSPDEFLVQALSIRDATSDELPKIQRAYDEAKRRLEGFKFNLRTHTVRYVPGGADVGTKSEKGDLEHVEKTFRDALRQEGIEESRIVKKDPTIQLDRSTAESGALASLVQGYDISEKNQTRWEVVPSEQLVMETKPLSDQSPKNLSSPARRNVQAGQLPQPRPDRSL